MASHTFGWATLSTLLLIAFFMQPIPAARLVNRAPADGSCALMVIPSGYKCEEHEVTTQDGYILSMQRIPEGREGGGGGGGRRQPVLLQHGVLMDGMTWILNSPDESLAFVLADSGFDVWIANTRGTRWSSRHVSLDPSSRSYWDWSWDELVTNDLPATVDFVYSQTGQKLHYVGHSLGTLVALASFSEGKLVDKLKSAALLSPVAYLTHMTTPIGILCAKAFVGEIITNWLGVSEFNPKVAAVVNFLKALCRDPGLDCYDLMRSFTGNNCCLNASTVELFLKYEPQPTSTKTMIHLAQTFRDGVLTKYNYERKDLNVENYGQSTPPVYNMSNIPNDLPLFLSYGGEDSLSDVRDVELLLDDLKFHDGDKLTVQFVKDYAHADFVMGISAKQIVYEAVVAFFGRN
ncbi:triacylglycerol lipase 2 [Typha latifolia]|uniref:triacylglycerol lipase 2 n=1 Tax=Typha latifolia TaxID=4733 RepID=UPI003C2E2260